MLPPSRSQTWTYEIDVKEGFGFGIFQTDDAGSGGSHSTLLAHRRLRNCPSKKKKKKKKTSPLIGWLPARLER